MRLAPAVDGHYRREKAGEPVFLHLSAQMKAMLLQDGVKLIRAAGWSLAAACFHSSEVKSGVRWKPDSPEAWR